MAHLPNTGGWTNLEASGPPPKRRVARRGPIDTTLVFHRNSGCARGEIASSLEPGALLCAFLDDIYVLSQRDRVVPVLKLFSDALARVAGIRLHEGKTRVGNRSGTVPEYVLELGQEGGKKQASRCLAHQSEVLSSPVTDCVNGVEEERRLWNAIPTVQDFQCAWHLLVQRANPRANHSLRTHSLLSSLSRGYAQEHDGIWEVMEALLEQLPGDGREQAFAPPDCHTDVEDGRLETEVSNSVRIGSVLGSVGGCSVCDWPTKPRSRGHGDACVDH